MPNGVRVAGNPNPIAIREERQYSAYEPLETALHYRGERGAVFAAFKAIARRSTRCHISQDGASATIDAIYDDLGPVIITVELDFNSVQREWWTAPAYVTLTAQERFAVLAGLKELADFAAEDQTAAEIASFFGQIDQELEDYSPLASEAFEDVFLNGDTYTALLPVITFTQAVSRFNQLQLIVIDVGKLFTTEQMAAIVPANAQWQIDEITNTIAANAKQTLAWLKTARFSVSSDGTSHLVQQFTFDAYATNRYVFA